MRCLGAVVTVCVRATLRCLSALRRLTFNNTVLCYTPCICQSKYPLANKAIDFAVNIGLSRTTEERSWLGDCAE